MKTKRGLYRIGCGAIIMMAASFATAQVGYVKPGGSGTNDGSSWANAYPGVATALANASGDGYTELWVEQGTYTVLESTIPSALEMYGGFDGTETIRADRDWAANTTTLESDGSTRVLNMTTNSVVDGFTITGGNAAGASATPNNGGAVRMENAPGATLRNCTLTGNQAQLGGALYVRGYVANNTNPEQVINCVFENNTVNVANGAGSAVFLMALAYTEFTGCTFTNNSSALAPPASRGNGAVDGQTWSVGTMHPKFFDSVFDSNSSGGSGGAINLYSNNSGADILVTIDGCTFTGNSAQTTGGALYLRGPGLKTITNSIFIGNESDSNNSAGTSNDGYGGAIAVLPFTNPAQANITNSVFAKNQSHGFGSAIYMIDGAANGNIVNNTFDGNTAKSTSAVDIAMVDLRPGTDLTIANNIFSNSTGRGVARITGASVEPLMLNNLFDGLTGWDFFNGADGGANGTAINDIGTNAGNKVGNPRYVDAAQDDYSLEVYSYAIASAHAASAPATDIEGTTRPLPVGTDPDIGAYEETTASETVRMTLTYLAGPNGSIDGDTPQVIDHGEDGTSVEAVADPGYTFIEWDDTSDANPRTDTNVTSDITVTATFADITPPTVESINRQTPATQLTNAASVTWRVVFSEAIDETTVENSDFTLTAVDGALGGAAVTGVANVNTTTFDVTASTGTGDKTLRLDVLPAATIEDPAGNEYDSTFDSGQTYDVDLTAPVTTVSAPGSLVGTELTISYNATDANDVTATALYVMEPGEATFANTGLSPSAGSFVYTAAASGTFQFGALSTDEAGNTESLGDINAITVVINTEENAALTLDVASGTDVEVSFPMADGITVTVTFAEVTVAGTLTIERIIGAHNAVSLGLDPDRLAGQVFVITADGGLAFTTAEIVFSLDETLLGSSLANLDAIDTVYVNRDDTLSDIGGTDVSVDSTEDTVTVTGVAAFSEWYFGDATSNVDDWLFLMD